jgi:hypothetical protein
VRANGTEGDISHSRKTICFLTMNAAGATIAHEGGVVLTRTLVLVLAQFWAGITDY